MGHDRHLDSAAAPLRSRVKTAGVIIAGGRSSRMGGVEKAFIEVGGKRILDRIVDRMSPQVDRLAINANGDAVRFQDTGLTVIPDLPEAAQTPLAGFHAALQWAKATGFDRLITMPSDAPFLPRDLVARLAATKQKAAIADSNGHEHYLTGLWPVMLGEVLDGAMKGGVLRVKDWARHVNAATVEWPVHPFDPFFNVNTPDDLALAQAIAAEFDQ